MNDFEIPGVIGSFLVILVIAIVIFLILREVVTWYWKINQRVGLLEDILAELQTLRKGATWKQISRKELVEEVPTTGQPISKRLYCGQCGVETAEGDEFCPECGKKLG